MLSNAYLLAKIGADTAENEQHFAEILPTNAIRAGDVAVDAVLRRSQLEQPRGRSLGALRAAPELLRGVGSADGRRHDGRSAKFRQNVARFRLYRHRSLQLNTRFAAFFKIYLNI